MSYEIELEIAKKAIMQAGNYIKENSNRIKIDNYKGNIANFATIHDIESDKIITKILKKKFPKDLIVSEELSPEAVKGKRVWIIDPIDGTRNFANNFAYHCISIALYDDGIKLGIIYAPSYNDDLYHAIKGEGMYYNGKKIEAINSDAELKQSIVVTGFAYFKGEKLRNELGKFGDVLENCIDVLRNGAAALDLCNVAVGRFGSYYERGIKIWDIAAGMLFVEEIGGIVTDYSGNEIDIFGDDLEIVASKNKQIHEKLLELIK